MFSKIVLWHIGPYVWNSSIITVHTILSSFNWMGLLNSFQWDSFRKLDTDLGLLFYPHSEHPTTPRRGSSSWSFTFSNFHSLVLKEVKSSSDDDSPPWPTSLRADLLFTSSTVSYPIHRNLGVIPESRPARCHVVDLRRVKSSDQNVMKDKDL